MGVPYAEVIGDPIAHSRSPTIHRFWLNELGIEGDYRAVRVKPGELSGYLESRRGDPDWRGCNVTMPLKEAAMAKVDTADPLARRIGALNTILPDATGLAGTNTDRHGIRAALAGVPAAGRSVAIVGAGGAARAALAAMAEAKPSRLTLLARDAGKAQALLETFGLGGDAAPIAGAPAADLLINASPLGMAGHPPLELSLARMPAGAAVFDMVYDPVETPLLREARTRGLRTVDGLSMLIHQAAAAFAFFFGKSPELADGPALRELLAR